MSGEQQQSGQSAGSRAYRWVVVVLLVIAAGTALYLRSGNSKPSADVAHQELNQAEDRETTAVTSGKVVEDVALPRLVDLGASKCVPCKLMAPILAELSQEFAGRFEVVFIDVWKKRSEAEKYGIRVIPTQVFYDPSGKELFRHEGFFSREDILKTWQEHGFDFGEDELEVESS